MKERKLIEKDFSIAFDGLHAWISAGWGTKAAAKQWLRKVLEED